MGHPSVLGVAAEHPSQSPQLSPTPDVHVSAMGTHLFPLCQEGQEHEGRLSHHLCQPSPLAHDHGPTLLPRSSATYVRQLDN